MTGSRLEFLGRHGELARPQSLTRPVVKSEFGAGLDPCGVLQVDVILAPGETRVVTFLLGEAATLDELRDLIDAYGAPESPARDARPRQRRVESPAGRDSRSHARRFASTSCVNRWLLYQSVSSRIWARTGFYQPSGAFGFRDQLQDVMALAYCRPDLYREHLLLRREPPVRRRRRAALVAPARGPRHAHPMLRRSAVAAVRRRPTTSGDRRRRRARRSGRRSWKPPRSTRTRHEVYALPSQSRDRRPRCSSTACRAIDRGLTVGAHGLPLMGSGDWNDGMNRVGHEGHGESVWLGWFLYHGARASSRRSRDARGDTRSRRALSRGGAASRRRAGAGLGWRLVSTRVLRRRLAARLGGERRVPDRLDRAVVGRAVGRRAAEARRARHGRRATRTWFAATRGSSCC